MFGYFFKNKELKFAMLEFFNADDAQFDIRRENPC